MTHRLISLATAALCALTTSAATDDKTPTMGWSSWNTYRVNINDSLIMRQADAMVATGLKDAGYTYINIDDGYFGGRDNSGRLLIHPTRFPKGLRPVVDHIHGLGLKAGIYSDAGRNTCGNYYDRDTIAAGVGLYGHDRDDARFFFKDLGFDYIKVDFCGGSAHQNHEGLALDERQRYSEIAKAIRSTGRKDVRLNVCRWNYPGTWVSDVASSWRISQDIHPRWSSVKDIISQNMYLSAYCHDGRYNDMDMLEVGRGMTQEEDMTHFGMWCIMSSPLLIGCDLTAISPATLTLLKNPELIALARDPLHLQAYPAVLTDDGCRILVKDILRLEGDTRAVAFYNPTDQPHNVSLDFADVDLDGDVRVRDLFARKDTGTHTGGMAVELPPHATRIFTLKASRRLPRRLYEAETAYISDYQELDNHRALLTGVYEDDPECSGGAKASWLGGKPENDLIWRNVMADRAGDYRLEITAMTKHKASLTVSVNGRDRGELIFPYGCTRSITVRLRKGINIVRLHNDTARMPDIDCMTVIPTDRDTRPSIKTDHLTVEKRKNLLGCDLRVPRFGWQIKSDKNNVRQESYRILVSSTSEKATALEGDVWDSGTVMSDSSQWVGYKGIPLKPDTRYHWRVKVITDQGESPWSAPSMWSTGIMDPSGQGAIWIGLDSLMDGDSQTRHSRLRARYLRKEFKATKPVARATAHICGLGFYNLFVNGSRVGDDALTPAPTDFTRSVIYNTYDVTQLIGDTNAIAVTLAPGDYYAMAQNHETNVRTTYGFPKMWMRLMLEYADGTSECIVSDESWRLSADGAIRYSNIYDGEMYDAGKEHKGMASPGFDDSSWMEAKAVMPPGGALTGNITPAMSAYRTEKPHAIRRTLRGWLVDFGTNNAGQLELSLRPAAGDTVTIRYAEMTEPGDTSLYRANLRSAESTDRFVGDGHRHTWHAEFVWHGFRYAEITPHDAVDPSSVSRCLVADRMDDRGTAIEFRSGDDIPEKVLANARRGIRSNYKGMPVDCPQRDERMPWLGDRTTGALGESFMMDNHALYSKWMKDIRECQRDNGAISDVAPAYWRLYNTNVTWPAALPMICDMLYRQYGDLRPMTQSYGAISRWLRYIKNKSGKDSLLTYDRYGDWCVPPESPDLIHSKDSTRITDGTLIASCYYSYICSLMEHYASLTGNGESGRYFANEAASTRKAINRKFLHDGTYSNSTVTANLLPLAMGIVPEEKEPQVRGRLVRTIEKDNDCHISAGVIGIQWLMRYLSGIGRGDLAWKIASTDSYPGWGYMVRKGATTIWELWNGDTANPAMNSANHVMLLGDLLPWCYENLGGIKSSEDAPGFRDITLRPDFSVKALDGVSASHPSPYGIIRSRWEIADGILTWDVEIPANCTASLHMPDGEIRRIGSGRHTLTAPCTTPRR